MILEEDKSSPAVIKVVGAGGGGMNAVTRMYNSNLRGVEFVIMNTDEQVLMKSPVENKVQIGNKITRGMGAGGDPDLGEKSAMEDREKILAMLKGADMVFVTAGMGGGTGTGSAPIIAQIAKEMKCLVVGVVTMPFTFEGKRRESIAQRGLEKLKEHVDTLITIRNDSIFQVVDKNTPIDQAFRVIDDILLNGVRGISDIINHPGIINVDFADVKAIMRDTGDAILGVGEGKGDAKVSQAVELAIHNSLLEEASIDGATSLLINVTGGKDLSIQDWNEVSSIISSQADPEANIIIGLNEDKTLEDRIRVTVIATGFNKQAQLKTGKENIRQSSSKNVQNTSASPNTKNAVTTKMVSNGGVVEEDSDSNGYRAEKVSQNISREEKMEMSRSLKSSRVFGTYPPDFEIPAYLRRKAE